jgi:hypothetical protein
MIHEYLQGLNEMLTNIFIIFLWVFMFTLFVLLFGAMLTF